MCHLECPEMGFIPKLIIAHGEFDMETDYLLKQIWWNNIFGVESEFVGQLFFLEVFFIWDGKWNELVIIFQPTKFSICISKPLLVIKLKINKKCCPHIDKHMTTLI